MYTVRAYDTDLAIGARKIDGALYVAVALQHGRFRCGRAWKVQHPKRIACLCAIAFVLCVSGTVSAAGSHMVQAHTVQAHTVREHTVSAHTVRAHTATRCTALDGHCTTYTVKAHNVQAHIVHAYTVATHTIRAHTAHNPRTHA